MYDIHVSVRDRLLPLSLHRHLWRLAAEHLLLRSESLERGEGVLAAREDFDRTKLKADFYYAYNSIHK